MIFNYNDFIINKNKKNKLLNKNNKKNNDN